MALTATFALQVTGRSHQAVDTVEAVHRATAEGKAKSHATPMPAENGRSRGRPTLWRECFKTSAGD